MILGIDEVGRGPWAGPLVMGAVILGQANIDGLNDSKKLTAKKRQALDMEIREQASVWALGWVSARELDDVGMSEALRLGCRRTVEQIQVRCREKGVSFDEIIIDGTVNFLRGTALEDYVTTMAKADGLIASVSAASIIAKVARDAYMQQQDAVYPGYGFASNAGYGTAAHRAGLEQLGACAEHRLSFAPLRQYAGAAAPLANKFPEQSGALASADARSEAVREISVGEKAQRIMKRYQERRANQLAAERSEEADGGVAGGATSPPSARVHSSFVSPLEMTHERSAGLSAIHEQSTASVGGGDVAAELLRLTHATIKKVTRDIEDEKFNTAVAAMMELVNGLYKIKETHGFAAADDWRFALESLLQILAPFAPHITEELWHQLGHDDTIHVDHWPAWDDKYLTADTMTIVVQVNGKLRAKLDLPADSDQPTIEAAALADDNVAKFITAAPKKVIYVPGKLVNFVV